MSIKTTTPVEDAAKLGGQEPGYYSSTGCAYVIKKRGNTTFLSLNDDYAYVMWYSSSETFRDVSNNTVEINWDTPCGFVTKVPGYYMVSYHLQLQGRIAADGLFRLCAGAYSSAFYDFAAKEVKTGDSIISLAAPIYVGAGDKIYAIMSKASVPTDNKILEGSCTMGLIGRV